MNAGLKRYIRKSIVNLEYLSKISFVAQKVLRHLFGPRLIIVAYHRVIDAPKQCDLFAISKRSFEEQIIFLKNNYNIITFAELIDNRKYLCNSKDCVIITFDDGHKDNFTHAAPILLKHKLSACFFVATELIDHLPQDAPREKDVKKYPGMTREDLKQLAAMGFEIGAHTVSHANLLQLPWSRVQREVTESQQELAQLLQQRVPYFAYPGGKRDLHYDQTTKEIVAAAGYKVCCTTNHGRNSIRNLDMLELNRVVLQNWWSPLYFAREIEGILACIMRQSLMNLWLTD
jgi:peptidoglycan/xylan/chitin deacetylase (PgdA/CDA1 family)